MPISLLIDKVAVRISEAQTKRPKSARRHADSACAPKMYLSSGNGLKRVFLFYRKLQNEMTCILFKRYLGQIMK
jgi:hypothetical protein